MLCSQRSAAAHDESTRKQSGSTFLALTLTVTSRHSQILGPASVKVFNSAGGSIGRGAGNDWVLPDPERVLSKRHFAVAFRGGSWQLADTSVNGTFLNRESGPIGAGAPSDDRASHDRRSGLSCRLPFMERVDSVVRPGRREGGRRVARVGAVRLRHHRGALVAGRIGRAPHAQA